MPLYNVHRDIAGWTPEDIEAAALRSELCVLWYEGMRWVRSYLDPERETLDCIFEAEREQDLRTHAQGARLPCGEIRVVVELLPPDLTPSDTAPPAEASQTEASHAGPSHTEASSTAPA